MADAPVQSIPGDENEQPQPGIGLCLSGGGYRAMMFHVGVLWRRYETGVLKTIQRISSVSGGSITAGVLGARWSDLGVAQPAKNSLKALLAAHPKLAAKVRIADDNKPHLIDLLDPAELWCVRITRRSGTGAASFRKVQSKVAADRRGTRVAGL